MRISIALILVVTAVNVIGRPHNDGTAHTHSPVAAPDSESVINIEGHNEAAVHHSDVDLGRHTKTGKTDLSHMASAQSEIAAAETHHSDTYMNGPEKSTQKPKPMVGSGHAPIIHVDNSGKNGDHMVVEGNVSVVSHGPMAKNLDEKKHDHEHGHHGHHDAPSTVNHAPMATEHHPKPGAAHHPQLSKSEPAIGHSPMVHPEHDNKPDNDESLNEHSAVTSTINHPPLATDHSSKAILAHHPSLSKIDTPLSHAPLAIPHGDERPESGIRVKRAKGSNQNSYAKKRTTSTTTTTTTTTSAAPQELSEDYTESEEYPSKEEPVVREKRSKGSNQKSYARKTTTTTTTTTTVAPTTEDSPETTVSGSSEKDESQEKTSEASANREKRSKGTNQKSYVKKTTTTTTTTPPAPTPKETFEASHRGSSEEQDEKQVRDKKPEEVEFREKRSKGSNRKAYSRTTPKPTTIFSPSPESTIASTLAAASTTATPQNSSKHSESHEHSIDDGSPFSPRRDKRSKGSQGSQRKSYARTTPTTTTTVTTPSPPTSEDPASVGSSEGPEDHDDHKLEELERPRRSHNKGGNNHFAKNPLTTRNYPTISTTPESADPTEEVIVRRKRSKGNYQKQQPRKTTITTTTHKPTSPTPTVSDFPEGSSEMSSLDGVEVTEKAVREKRSKGSNQNSYAKKHHITTTIAPKAPESNVAHPSLSKTEPLIPGKPEEPKKPEPSILVTVADTKPVQPPQIIPGSHPLAIPLPTNPPAS